MIIEPRELINLTLHDALITSIGFDPQSQEISLSVERHSGWLKKVQTDLFAKEAHLKITFTGIYDFDLDCGGMTDILTIDKVKVNAVKKASTDDFVIWLFRFSLQEGVIKIRSTGLLINVVDNQ